MSQISTLGLLVLLGLCQLAPISADQSNHISDVVSDNRATPIASSMTQSAPSNDGSPMLPIMRAIEIIEFVSKFSNSESEGFGVTKIHSALEVENDESASANDLSSSSGKDSGLTKTTDPLTALASLVVYSAVRLSSILLSILMSFFTFLNPGAFSFGARGSNGIGPFDHIDYNVISNSIRSIPAKSFALFDIRDADCQNRAMCEIGQSISGYFPTMARLVRFGAEQFNWRDMNTEAIIRGLGWLDCTASYKSCPRSPFKKFQQIITTFTKLY